jgi:LmbE family N-acetylglucosaminyl deacetylase
MPLFRQAYRVTPPSGAPRLPAVHLMAKSVVEAKDAAIDTIKSNNACWQVTREYLEVLDP